MRVPVTALPSGGDEDALSRLREVVKEVTALEVENDSAQGNGNLEIVSALSMLVAAFAMPAAVRTERVVVAEFQERVFLIVGDQVDAAAVTAVASARTASGDKLFPPKGNTAVPAVSGVHRDFGFVYEHGEKSVSDYLFPIFRENGKQVV